MTGFLDGRANLAGKVAAVVGGGGGIGRAVTLALAGAGVDIAFLEIKDELIDATRRDAEALGRRVLARRGDATSREDLAAFYKDVGDTYDRLDIVVNLVGGVTNRDLTDGTQEEDDADVRRNYGYIIDSVRYALPLIRRNGRGGSIINFTTIEAHRGAAGYSVYAGAKAATTNFTKAMAVELGKEKIRMNTIAPDTTPSTRMWTNLHELPDSVMESIKMYIPLKELPDQTALANGVLFLASDLSAFVTGVALHIDGGTQASMGFIDWPYEGGRYMPVPTRGAREKLFGLPDAPAT